MNNTELQLNKLAQGFISIQNGIDWFDTFDRNEKKEIFQILSVILTQAHPTSDEIANGIEQSKLKPSCAPCALIDNCQDIDNPKLNLPRISGHRVKPQERKLRIPAALHIRVSSDAFFGCRRFLCNQKGCWLLETCSGTGDGSPIRF